MRIRDLGEEEVIKKIIFPLLDDHNLDKLDDAIAIQLDELYLVLNVDTLVESTDVLPNTAPEEIGWKIVVMTVSDVVAKGAKPLFFVDSITLEANRKIDYIKRVFRGIKEACKVYNIKFLGGDLNESDEFTITGVAIGLSNKVVSRKGAMKGDSIWITGEFGFTGLAFHYLLRDGEYIEGIEEAITVAKKPRISLKSGEVLSEIASSSMDSSDGLAYTLNTLAEENNLKFSLTDIPIPKLVQDYADKNNIDPLELILFGGEEFEIVFTTNLSDEKVIEIFEKKAGIRPIKIGYVEYGEGVYYGGKRIEKRGWQHFRRN